MASLRPVRAVSVPSIGTRIRLYTESPCVKPSGLSNLGWVRDHSLALDQIARLLPQHLSALDAHQWKDAVVPEDVLALIEWRVHATDISRCDRHGDRLALFA